MEIIKTFCMQYFSEIQDIILILAIIAILVAGAYAKTYSERLFKLFSVVIFIGILCIPGIYLAKLKEKEIKEQLLSASSKEEIQEILKDIPKLSIINLKKDLENEKEIALYDLEILLLKNRENKGDK